MKTKEIRIRAIDCEQLNMQVIFVNNPSDIEQAKKNVLMINAADELLEACQAFIEYDENGDDDGVGMMIRYADARRMINAAVKKATSQQNNTSEK